MPRFKAKALVSLFLVTLCFVDISGEFVLFEGKLRNSISRSRGGRRTGKEGGRGAGNWDIVY